METLSEDRPAALKIATEVVETLRVNPHQKSSAWPLELFVPLARDYLRLMEREIKHAAP